MRKGFVVREKGYEYNDNWYDLDPMQDHYTEVFDSKETALNHAKLFTAKFLSGRHRCDYFNEQPYNEKLSEIVAEKFPVDFDINSKLFSNVWNYIKNDIAQVLSVEIEDGDPCVVHYSDGTKMYYKDNLLHRIGKPAVERPDGTCEYHYKGQLHRLDGEAIATSYGEGYYIAGDNYYNKEEFKSAVNEWLQNNRDYQIDQINS